MINVDVRRFNNGTCCWGKLV